MTVFKTKEDLIKWAKVTDEESFPVMFSLWSKDDVIEAAGEEKLTDAEVVRVMEIADDSHDASIGINWESLSCAVNMVIDERSNDGKETT